MFKTPRSKSVTNDAVWLYYTLKPKNDKISKDFIFHIALPTYLDKSGSHPGSVGLSQAGLIRRWARSSSSLSHSGAAPSPM